MYLNIDPISSASALTPVETSYQTVFMKKVRQSCFRGATNCGSSETVPAPQEEILGGALSNKAKLERDKLLVLLHLSREQTASRG